MDNEKGRLMGVMALANDYCATIENAREMEKADFVASMINYLPRLYWEFSDISIDKGFADADTFYNSYIDEEHYNAVREGAAAVLGADDTYLETFEEDMKYSDTPIGASVAEGLADIYQDLYNFVVAVRESEGKMLESAFAECKENFVDYWSQTLCNVMRPLNRIHNNPEPED